MSARLRRLVVVVLAWGEAGVEYWAKPPLVRGQMVLFATRLDEVLVVGHPARMLDEILSRIDWSPREAGYDLKRGQPPIHPRVLAGVILYGLLTRIRSSRMLEEALSVRLDFRWLAGGGRSTTRRSARFGRSIPRRSRTCSCRSVWWLANWGM